MSRLANTVHTGIAKTYVGPDTGYLADNPSECRIYIYTARLEIRFTPNTVCPRSIDPFDIVSYYINQVKTSWTYGTHKHGPLLIDRYLCSRYTIPVRVVTRERWEI